MLKSNSFEEQYPYHPALVSDLMEEFRALVVDSLVMYLVNRNLFTID